MNIALLNNKEISIYSLLEDKRNYSNFKENYLMLRRASRNKELHCKGCNEVLVFVSTENVETHFKHSKGNAEKCSYSKYVKSLTKEHKLIRNTVLNSMISIFSDMTYDIEKEISTKYRSDIILKFSNGNVLALDYLSKIGDLEFEEKNQYYLSNNINNIWIMDIRQKTKIYSNQDEMEFKKRAILNESKDKVLCFIDIEYEKIILESEQIASYEGYSDRWIISKAYNISDIKLNEEGSFYEYNDYVKKEIEEKIKELKQRASRHKSVNTPITIKSETKTIQNNINKPKRKVSGFQINDDKLKKYSSTRICDIDEMRNLVNTLSINSNKLSVNEVIYILEGYNNHNYYKNYFDTIDNVKKYANKAVNENYDNKEKYMHLTRFKFLRDID